MIDVYGYQEMLSDIKDIASKNDDVKLVKISSYKYPELYTLIDKIDYDYVSKFNWFVRMTNTHPYAMRSTYDKELKKKSKQYLHRDILNVKKGLVTDHINHNSLDNRRINLRICTVQQNLMNSKLDKKGSSKHKGVSFNKKSSKWQAYVHHNYKKIHLGYFLKEEDAVKKYNEVSSGLFKEYSNPNVINLIEG